MRRLSTLAFATATLAGSNAYAQTLITDNDVRGATVDGAASAAEYPAHTDGAGDGFGGILGASKLGVQVDVLGGMTWALFRDPAASEAACDAANHFVVYIDSEAGGFGETSNLTDNADSHRTAISGVGADLTFPTGFQADYAIAFNDTFAGLWKLEANGSHTFVATLTSSAISGCQRELSGMVLADIGLKPGASFQYFATLLNPATSFRSNEFHGVGMPPASNIGANAYAMPADGFIDVDTLSVVINEVDSDTLGVDAAEFVEILASPNADLTGLSLVYWNGSTDLSYFSANLTTADANGYFVVGNTAVTPDISHNGNFLQNGQDAVALYLAPAISNGTVLTSTRLVDLVVYDTSDPDDPGLLALFPVPMPQLNESGGANSETESLQRCAGDALDTTYFYTKTATPRAANDCPVCLSDNDCGSCEVCDLGVGLCVTAANDTVCDDGDLCTSNDVCTAGVCGGGALDCSNLNDACLVGQCNASNGQCEAVAVPDNTSCDDANACTTTDVCTSGVCGGTTVDCSNLDSTCSAGQCNTTNGQCEAVAINEGGACSDGNACTTLDTCVAGTCAGASPVDCSSFDSACSAGQCDVNTGVCEAIAINEGSSCDDGSLCTTTDVCTSGTCGGTAVDCSNLDGACATGTCNINTGACEAVAATDGTSCDDGDACTSADACTSGTCGGTALDCSNLDGACAQGSCNATTGACEAVATNEGQSCDDGSMCTSNDVCTSGTCGGTAVDCSNLDSECAVGLCNATTGTCEAVAANEGQSCDDGEACTDGDTCTQGSCGGGDKDCSSLDTACTVGMCDAETGDCVAVNVDNGTACDDGSMCTENDVCTDGACGGTAVAAGTACGDACNAGVCDGVTGTCDQEPLADGTSCNDANPCTTNDVCTAGACAGAAGNNGALCDDGDACTVPDACFNGVCVGGPDACNAPDMGGEVDAGDYDPTNPTPTGPVASGELEGGCSTAGGDPMWMLALLGLLGLRRR